MNKFCQLLLCSWLFWGLSACQSGTEPLDEITAVPAPVTPEIRVVTEFSYALEPREQMIKSADAIFVGRVTDISPTQYNQDSGEYWEQTTVEGPGLETTHTALPVFTIELTVDEVLVDDVGLGETAVLTQVGGSPLGGNSDWSIQVGDEIVAFVVRREIAWWDGQPVRAVPYEDGLSFEVGRREALRFANAPRDTYLLRQSDGRYTSLPDAYEPWPPLPLDEFRHGIALFRPVQTGDGVALSITTPEPSPTPAVCTSLPEGMTFTIKPTLANEITLDFTGLQPGEKLHLIFTQEKPDGMFQMEEWDLPAVEEDGLFSHTTRLSSPYDAPNWQIKVIHARGVVCTEITLPLEETAVPESTESQIDLSDLKAELPQTPPIIPTAVSPPLSPTTGSKLLEITDMIETAVPNPTWSIFSSAALQFTLQYPPAWQVVEQGSFVYLLSDERFGEGPEPLNYFVYSGEYLNPDNLPFPDAINASFNVDFPVLTSYAEATIGPYTAYITTDLPSREGALSVLIAGNGRYLNLALTPFQADLPYPEQARFAAIFAEILASLQLN